MRPLVCLIWAGLLAAGLLGGCSPPAGGGRPAPLPAAPVITPLPELPAPTELPTPTEPPAPTGLATPPRLVAAGELPAATELPASTALPTPVAAPVAPLLAPMEALLLPSPTATDPPAPDPTLPPDPSRPRVIIGGVAWTVELALTPQQRAQGLSGREELPAGAGMLFIYDRESRRSFWMPDMHFPLDLVWIDGDCAVAHITRNAPPQAPGQSRADLPRYSADKVQYVLEINAGEADAHGIRPGAPVKFNGARSGAYGC